MYLIEQMTRPEVEARIREYPVAILPVGSCEQHGPHLPLGTDSILAYTLAARISAKTGALVFPPMHFGYSWVWRDIAGTGTIDNQHLKAVLKDIALGVHRYGVRLLVLLNGHEANNATIKYVVREAQDETPVKLLGMFYPGMSEIYDKVIESPTWHGMFHACEFETSLMLAARPDLVKMDFAVAEYPEKPALYGLDNTSIGSISKSGVYGNPTLATREKGEALFDFFTDKAAALIHQAYEQLTTQGT